MGMVFQSFNLFEHMTVIENIMTAPMDLLNKTRQEVSAFQKGRDKRCAAETTDYYAFAYENLQFVPIKLASPVLALALCFKVNFQ